MIRHLPNILSALRLLLAPLAAWLILHGHDTAALAVFAIAALSDGLDGMIARRWGFTSDFGAWLDPLADKLLMLFCFTALFAVKATPLWLLGIVVARDAGLIACWIVIRLAELPVTLKTLAIGKLSTAVQLVYVLALLAMLAFGFKLTGGMGGVARGLGYLTALVTLAAAFAYARAFARQLLHKTPAA